MGKGNSKPGKILSKKLLCFLGLCLLLWSDANAQRRIPGDFAPGDGVRIITWQAPTARGNIESLQIADDYVIDRRGMIFLPLIGYIRAIGLSKDALSDTLEKRYQKYASGLSFVCKPLIRITVFGAVNKPGSYIVEPTESLWSVIDQAGGPLTGAEFEKMYYMRNGQIVAENLLAQFERAYSVEEIGIRSGDQLYLPTKRSFRFRTLIEYTSFLSSLIILYFTIDNNRKN